MDFYQWVHMIDHFNYISCLQDIKMKGRWSKNKLIYVKTWEVLNFVIILLNFLDMVQKLGQGKGDNSKD